MNCDVNVYAKDAVSFSFQTGRIIPIDVAKLSFKLTKLFHIIPHT